MIPVARRAATAALIGAALTLVFCSSAGADPVTDSTVVTTTSAPPPTTTAAPTTTTQPTPPVTAPSPRRIVLIGTADSVQSSVIQSVDSGPVQAVDSSGAPRAARTLPHTGTTSAWLALFGFALVLLGVLATRGPHPQLRLSERS